MNRYEVLKKMPEHISELREQDANSSLNETLIELFKEYRGSSEEAKKKRGKKLPKKLPNLEVCVPGRALQVKDTPNSADHFDDPFAILDERQTITLDEQRPGRSIWTRCSICKTIYVWGEDGGVSTFVTCDMCGNGYHIACLIESEGLEYSCPYCATCSSGDESDEDRDIVVD